MKKITFHMSDKDWKSIEPSIGDDGKYLSITDCMNSAVRALIARNEREARSKIREADA